MVLWGSGDAKIRFSYASEGEDGSYAAESERTFKGAIHTITRLYRTTKSDSARRYHGQFLSQQPCVACGGTKLCAEARAVTLGDQRITGISTWAIDQVLLWLDDLFDLLPAEAIEIGGEALNEVGKRLQFMVDVGLHYLTLNRPAPTLSGGEGQRIRLASQIGSGLVGVMYILDEPSIGLHQRDQRDLIGTLE